MNREKLIANYEKILAEKIFLKTNSNSCDSETLLKYFRYYDIYNNGFCSLNDFINTMKRIGITKFSDEELKSIFYSYNIGIDSKLNYIEFVQNFYNISKKKIRNSPILKRQINQVPSNLKVNPYFNIVEGIRKELMKRGIRGFFDLYNYSYEDNQLKIFDLINLNKELKLKLSEEEIKELFEQVDYIDYEQLKRNIRGNLNDNRKLILETVYKNIYQKYNGGITLSLLFTLYDPKNHPDVIRNLVNEKIIFYDFCETFHTLHHYYYNISLDKIQNSIPFENFLISLDEFIEYYENISPFISDEKLFSDILKYCFTQNKINNQNLNNNNSYDNIYSENTISKKEGNNNNEKRELLSSLEKLKNILKSRGPRGLLSLRRNFILSDSKNLKRVSFEDFQTIIDNYRLGLSNKDIYNIYNKYCLLCNKGFIEYEDLINDLIGQLNKKRIELIRLVFERLMRYDSKTYIRLEDIKNKFNPKGHPDFINGKRNDEDILAEFLDYYQYHFELLNDENQRFITYSQFIDFYKYISFCIDDDNYFEKMIKGVWNIIKNKSHLKNDIYLIY